MTKDPIYLECKIIYIMRLNITAPKCIKETLTNLKREKANSTIIVGDFSTSTFSNGESI